MLDPILGKDIASYVRRHNGLVWLSIGLAAVSSLFVVIPAYLLQPFVDEGMKTSTDPASWKIPWIAIQPGTWFSWEKTHRVLVENISPNRLLLILTTVGVISALLKSITIYFSEYTAAAFSNRAVQSMRIDLFAKFVSLHLGFFHRRRSGEMIARAVADLTVMQGQIAHVIIGLIQYPLTAVVFLAYLFFMNYQLTLLVFLAAPLLVGLIRLFGRKVKKHARRVQDTNAELTSAYQEALVCLKVIQGFFQGGAETAKFRALAERLYERVMRWRRWDIGVGPGMDAAVFIIGPCFLLAAKIHFNHTLGELLSMIYAFSRLYAPVKKLGKVISNLKTLQGSTERVFGIMEAVPDIQDPPRPKVLGRHERTIRFDRVSFGYSPDHPVLRDVSFEVSRGEMVAFVGPTGAGKSTLLDLIPRFYDVTGGAVTIDGIDVREADLGSLRHQIGIVNQDILLFHESIADNIRYGRPDATEEELFAAARAAHAHDFILAQPKGYDTVIGDRGALLSGGQRQRIAIARALLVTPSILILDEAASALDSESEKKVQQAIEKLVGGPTILVVAHRLSTIMKAHRIFVLEDGRIIESGTMQTLLASGGRFQQLYRLQFEVGAGDEDQTPNR